MSLPLNLSMMSYTMARQPEYFSLAGMLQLTRELDLAGVDFVRLHDADPKELRRLADDYGVPVICHTFFASLADPTPEGRRQAIDQAKRSLDDAATLGAPVVMIPTPGKAEDDRDEARRRWIDGLAEVVPHAVAAGIVPTVENFPGRYSPFVVAADFAEAKRQLPELKLTYDNGNAAGGEDPVESFRRCAADVAHVHFKDWYIHPQPAPGAIPMLDGRYFRAALIGEGDLDQPACLAALRDAGYTGCVNIEYEGNDYPPAEAVRRAVEYLREQWAQLT